MQQAPRFAWALVCSARLRCSGNNGSMQLGRDALQACMHFDFLVQVPVYLVQVEKAKSQAAEQACHKAQEDAKQSAKHLNQVSQMVLLLHAGNKVTACLCGARHKLHGHTLPPWQICTCVWVCVCMEVVVSTQHCVTEARHAYAHL